MRIAVLSDIHGNNPALESVLEHIRLERVDSIIVAGDIIGGPESDRTIELVQDAADHVIRGNQEQYFIDQLANPDQFASLRWALIRAINRRISEKHVDYITGLPLSMVIEHENHRILIVHSTPDATNEVFFPDQDEARTREILSEVDEDALICGHSHRQWVLKHNGTLGANCGSTGIPLSDDLHAQYAIVNIGKMVDVELKRVPYDRERFDAIFTRHDFFGEIGPIGKGAYGTFRSGRPLLTKFIKFARSLDGGEREGELVDNVLQRADSEFDWSSFLS